MLIDVRWVIFAIAAAVFCYGATKAIQAIRDHTAAVLRLCSLLESGKAIEKYVEGLEKIAVSWVAAVEKQTASIDSFAAVIGLKAEEPPVTSNVGRDEVGGYDPEGATMAYLVDQFQSEGMSIEEAEARATVDRSAGFPGTPGL